MLKKLIITLLFFLSILYRSQTLDQLDNMTENYIEKAEYQKAIDLNIESLGKYKDEKNKEGIAVAYLNLADLLRNLNQPKKSLENLDEAKKYINTINDNILRGRLYVQYAKSYSHLDIEGEANTDYNKAIQCLGKVGNSEKVKKYLYQAYIGKWADFEYTKAIDSAVATQNKCLKLFPNDPMVYTLIAYRYVGMNSHFDTIKSNLDKALSLSPKGTQKGTTLLTLGDYYTLTDDFPKALDCNFQALEVFQKIGRKISIRDCYKNIRRTYLLLKDKERADEYGRKFKVVNDEVVKIQKESSIYAVKKLVQEKEQEEQSKRTKLYIIIGIITILSLLGIYFLRKVYLKRQKKKDELIDKKEELLEKKNKAIERKTIETDKLKKRVNASFDKLVQMAKDGDPFFLIKFKEVYPDFNEKLINNHPDLTELDIKFCAYLRLNLSNKEIIQYENVTLRTIETRRYRLKKKLGLSSEIDLAKWIMEL